MSWTERRKKEKLQKIKACLGNAETEIISALNHVRDMKEQVDRELKQ